MKVSVIVAIIAALLAGCATNADYYGSINRANEHNAAVAIAKANADAEKYRSLGTIATNARDAQTQIAAVLSIALGGNGIASANSPSIQPAAPQPSAALQWATILLPTVGQLGTGYYGMRTAINASNNARDLGMSTNSAFTAMGATIGTAGTAGYRYIQAPGAVTTTTTTTTDSHNIDNHAVDDHSATAPPTIVQQPAPVIVQP